MTLHQWVALSLRGTRIQREAFETGQLEAAEFLALQGQQSVVIDADVTPEVWDVTFDFWARLSGVVS